MPTTIEAIEPIPFRLPLREPLRWGAASVMQEARHVLVRVRLNDGAVGWGEAPPRPTIYGETVSSICSVVRQELAPRLEGEMLDDSTLSKLYARLQTVKNNQTARGALDMALHHALAKSRNRTLYEHLGAGSSHVRVSYILGLGEIDDSLAEAERTVAQGVRVLKVKVGQDWSADLQRLRLLREQFGEQVDLYVDANECLQPQNVRQRLEKMAELNVLYCEEPLPVELILARAAVRKACDRARDSALPQLIADDSVFSARDLRRELSMDTFHILNIKTARTGFTESAQMLNQALVAGKAVMVGSQASTGWGTVLAALFAARPGIDLPCELSFFLKLQEDLLTQPLTLRDGYLDVSGLAQAEIDADRLRAARLKE
ncbi:MAG: enolase [Caldilineaceae bacterium]|nr:enolase [Caldilineaceae bacterium]MDE0339980.1 enolase [Caldilineaceae bacterium]